MRGWMNGMRVPSTHYLKRAAEYEVRLANGTACPHCARRLRPSDVIIDLDITVICAGCHRDLLVIRRAE